MRYVAALILCASFFMPSVADAARLWSSGCELQGDTGGTPTSDLEFYIEQSGGTMSIATDIKRSGLSSCKVIAPGSSIYAAFAQEFASSPVTTALYARFYLYIDTAPSSNTEIAIWYNSLSDLESALVLTSSRTLLLYDDAESQVGSYTTPLSTGTWYRIEMLYHSAVDNLDVRLDGVTIIDASCNACDGSNFFGVGVENFLASPSGTFYFDDIALNDSSGGSQTSWPGAGSIVHADIDGAGDNSGCSSGSYADVDERTPDSADCILSTDGGGDILDATVESASSAGIDSYDTVTLVQVGVRESAETAAAESWKLRVKSASGGTVTEGTTTSHNDVTYRTNGDAVPRNYTLTSYTDPTTGIAWTPTGINSIDNMQIGIASVDANPDINVDMLWGLVEYVDGSQVGTEKMRARLNGGSIKIRGGRIKLQSN